MMAAPATPAASVGIEMPKLLAGDGLTLAFAKGGRDTSSARGGSCSARRCSGARASFTGDSGGGGGSASLVAGVTSVAVRSMVGAARLRRLLPAAASGVGRFSVIRES